MKILFVTRGFPSKEDPMDGNYEAVQAKAIAAKGHEVSVIAIKWKTMRHFLCNTKVTHRMVDGINIYEGTKIYPVIPHFQSHKFELFFRQLIFNRVFKRYIKEIGLPDIVHAHILIYAAPSIYIKKKYNIPFVITEHWSKVHVGNLDKRLYSQSSAYLLADRLICVSESLQKSLKNFFGVESQIINNMVSDVFFRTQKVERNDGKFRFIACGALRTSRVKGFDILVDAFASAHFSVNVSLDIVGDGPDKNFLQNRIDSYGLSGQVHLLGVKTPEEVSQLLCLSDCFVLSSRTETFSIVVIEAMAKGLPVVATRCGGPETFLHPNHGLLVDKENIEQLSEAMSYMTNHYSEYDSDKIREFCYSHFSQDIISDKIINVYNQAINK